jgi:hypothetical protein
VNTKALMRIGPEVAAGASVVMALRRARRSGDKLELADAVISGLAVITGVLLLIRRLRKGEELA